MRPANSNFGFGSDGADDLRLRPTNRSHRGVEPELEQARDVEGVAAVVGEFAPGPTVAAARDLEAALVDLLRLVGEQHQAAAKCRVAASSHGRIRVPGTVPSGVVDEGEGPAPLVVGGRA